METNTIALVRDKLIPIYQKHGENMYFGYTTHMTEQIIEYVSFTEHMPITLSDYLSMFSILEHQQNLLFRENSSGIQGNMTAFNSGGNRVLRGKHVFSCTDLNCRCSVLFYVCS